MKRIVWAALLVLASGQAAADWVNIGSDANAELFVDRSTIARPHLGPLTPAGSGGGVGFRSSRTSAGSGAVFLHCG